MATLNNPTFRLYQTYRRCGAPAAVALQWARDIARRDAPAPFRVRKSMQLDVAWGFESYDEAVAYFRRRCAGDRFAVIERHIGEGRYLSLGKAGRWATSYRDGLKPVVAFNEDYFRGRCA